MEWTRKPDFADYLNASIEGENTHYYQAEIPLYILEKPIEVRISPLNVPYPKNSISLSQRKEKYLANWDLRQQKAWQRMEELAKKYRLQEIYPWWAKDAFKKLAKRCHPDHNSMPYAAEDFQALYRAYKSISELL
tara:strand:- start:20076 stop:20480 length:405 start_codon:yes stop_codon:yes gene_type:complete